MGTSPDEMRALPRSKPHLQDEAPGVQHGESAIPCAASLTKGQRGWTHPSRQKLVFGLAIFASAFLLFQVQPLITKIILPWFGGVAAVWTVCLLFFQVALLAGYFYAHILSTRFAPKAQAWIHASIVAASLLTLPILP